MVGGERANDREFREKRLRQKDLHERRRALLAQLLAQTEDEDGVLLRVYDNIQEEVRAKNEVIKKYKQKVVTSSFCVLHGVLLSCSTDPIV